MCAVVIPHVTETKVCAVSGDPHFYTYDRLSIGYQGVCMYTLSETKNIEAGTDLTPFSVNIKPEHRNGNTAVSWTQYIEITVYGTKITFQQGSKIFVRILNIQLC